jgi:AraC-like DNA-binding protein
MIAVQYKPAAPLADFVDCIWYWDGYRQPHPRERLLPDGCSTIVFQLDENLAGSDPDVFVGARATSFVVETRHMVITFGIQFKPGGAFAFLGFPARELSEQNVSLDLVFGRGARSLRDRLLEQPRPDLKAAVAEQWLTERLARRRHPAVEYALRGLDANPTVNSVGDVLDRIGYSHRHFLDKFSAEVGLTPKRYARVRRFQRVLQSLATVRDVDWVDLALRYGYYDQPHFVHDFKDFTSLTPESYLRLRTPHLNHIPVSE